MKHLDQKGYTYFSHLKRAWTFSYYFFVASLRAFIHGIYPDAFPGIVVYLKEKLPGE